jgi:hypothetical protein
MIRAKLPTIAMLAACLAGSTVHAQDKLLVQVPAILDPAAPIVESVRRECGVELLVGNLAFQRVSRVFPAAAQITDAGKAGSDHVLRLTILSVHGIGGGAWTGSKSMTVRADVVKDAAVLRTTVLQRSSTGGMWGGMRGTCGILERIATALGQDAANWLAGRGRAPQAIDLAPQGNDSSPAPQPDESPAAAQPLPEPKM